MYKLENIVYRLIIPTIIFSSLFFIPKMLFHSNGISIQDYCINVLGGISYWFTSALVVTQVLMIILCFFNSKNVWLYCLISILLLFAIIFLKDYFPSNVPWYWKSGFAGCFLFSMGGLYHQYEYVIDKYSILLIFVVSIVIVAVASYSLFSPAWVVMGCHFNISGFILMTTSSLLLIQLMKRVPYIKIFNYIEPISKVLALVC